ncbi:MAG: ADP-ribosylglycohydrolase family protein [Planctomycetes bacterium]|nr:ADP-ribosylglycohydrolase family protein [Planctomycetota bacterium]
MPPSTGVVRRDRIAGVLLGTAVGDALGLPREGLSPQRAQRIFGDDVRHALVHGRGMVSDDTEHTCLVAQSLLAAPDDATRFAESLAWKLRFWLLGLPAGVGLGTARAIAKLWVGFGPSSSGVCSAGNGPAMRAAVVGVCHATDRSAMRSFIRASTRITHTDERAERAAFLVAFATAYAATRRADEVVPAMFLRAARTAVWDADEELSGILTVMEEHVARGVSVQEFASALGLTRGVSGYAYHTVPVALYAWLSHPGDFRAAVTDVIRLGGDTDTTGAIVGGICGAGVGASGIPRAWIDGLWEWPRSVAWMNDLADRLAPQFPDDGSPPVSVGELPLAWPLVLPRNVMFLAIVLGHGFRRLLPPYGGGT